MTLRDRLAGGAIDVAKDLRWRARQTVRPLARPVARTVMASLPLALLLRERERYRAARVRAGMTMRPSPLLRACRFRLVPSQIETYSPPDRPDLRFVNASSAVVQETFWHGMDGGRVSAEAAQVALWEQLCARATEVVEIGANIGFLTVPGAKATTAPYRAVEPHPRTAGVLRRNVELNGLQNVEVVEKAALPGAVPDFVELIEPASDPFPTPTAAAIPGAGGNSFAGKAIRVAAASVATLVGKADLLKLDVEGMELPLLQALEPCLLERRPTLMIEVLDDNYPLKEWLSAFATAHSYEIEAITATGTKALAARELPGIRLTHRYGTRDVLVVPRTAVL